VPGSDELRGVCSCHATAIAADPVQLLDWLAGHPVGHELDVQHLDLLEPDRRAVKALRPRPVLHP
jgi:hypothetical protein